MLLAVGDTPRVFDTPDLTARVYNQLANTIIKKLVEYFEQHFALGGREWLANPGFRFETLGITTFCYFYEVR